MMKKLNDETLSDRIAQEIKSNRAVVSNDVVVNSSEGIVILRGTTDSSDEKALIEKIASNVLGVRAIVNDVVIEPISALLRSDYELARAVAYVIAWSSGSPQAVTATVDNGWVRLYGEVLLDREKRSAERAAHGVFGVRGVTNDILVNASRSDERVVEAKTIQPALEDSGRVETLCQKNAVTIRSNASLQDAAIIMDQKSVGFLVVTDADDSPVIIGVLTDRDIVCRAVARGLQLEEVKVEAIMTRDVVEIQSTATYDDALTLMTARRVRRLLVKSAGEVLLGVLSTDDFARTSTATLKQLGDLYLNQTGTGLRQRTHDFTRMA